VLFQKKPKVVQSTMDAENFLYYDLIMPYLKKYNLELRSSEFYKHTDIKTEMLNNGYDGLDIYGRETVYYTPKENELKYFKNEFELERYFWDLVKWKEIDINKYKK